MVQAAPQMAPGRILVKPVAGLSQEKLERILERSKGKAVRKLRGLEVRVVQVPERAERAVARAAGLGFVGKNTVLIMPRNASVSTTQFHVGSFIFLTELLLDLPLSNEIEIPKVKYENKTVVK